MNIGKIREDFPVLHQEINKHPLIYLDNGATTQKPKQVINTITDYYSNFNSNVHRGVHSLSQKATEAYEDVRISIQQFVNAKEKEEIIFTRGTTESINLVANSFGEQLIEENDEIIVSVMEHHANIVPWQILSNKKKAKLKIIPVNNKGEFLIDDYEKLFSKKTKIVAFAHISNVLGTINPIKKMIQIAHRFQVPVLIDGAQAIAHTRVDVQDLDCDFYAFSGHKMYAPMGIGVLYGKRSLLEQMPPYQSGGEMIQNVSFEETTFNELPYKFEAGTPSVADALGLKAAIEYINNIGIKEISDYENHLLDYATKKLLSIDGLKIIGIPKIKLRFCPFY